MTKLHRKDLKQDEVREKVSEAVRSVSLHGREVIYIITFVLAVGFIALVWWYYEKNQQQESQKLLGTALKKMEAPVGDEAAATTSPVKPEFSYKTDTEKYHAALKDFEQIIIKYGNTQAADMARYQAGVCAYYLNDSKMAEEYLKQSTKVSERNILYYLSRIALSNFYNSSGRTDEAVKVLKEAIDKNKDLVPQENLLLQLADVYEKAGKKKEARETLQKIVDGYKESPSSFQAQNRLNELKDK